MNIKERLIACTDTAFHCGRNLSDEAKTTAFAAETRALAHRIEYDVTLLVEAAKAEVARHRITQGSIHPVCMQCLADWPKHYASCDVGKLQAALAAFQDSD